MTRRGWRRIECVLLAAGLAILGYCSAELLNSHIQQARGARELDQQLGQTRRDPPAVSAAISDGTPVGQLQIPTLHLSAVVFQGTSDGILAQGVGHLDASAFPGQAGNVVLAAHRDTFFRSLRNIRKGDLVQVSTPYGIRTYAVDSTEVVKPTETSVTVSTATPTLTLITCYPFYYVGHAPKRFIVRASPVSG
jgi:sortase A